MKSISSARSSVTKAASSERRRVRSDLGSTIVAGAAMGRVAPTPPPVGVTSRRWRKFVRGNREPSSKML